MKQITEEQAAALAEAFIIDKKSKYKCGALAKVSHKPASGALSEAGTYHVEFTYAGPPVVRRTRPPRDHPTIVLVNDQSGECRVMYWM